MPAIPQAPGFDHTLALLRDPYHFVSSMCDALGSDVFRTRLLLTPTICMRGAAAAELFYSSGHLMREGAALRRVEKTLVGKGGVQGLDDAAHRHRKAMFLEILTADRVHELSSRVRAEWARRTVMWRRDRPIRFYDVARELLMQEVCAWSGVPLPSDDLARRTAEVAALFDYAGSIGPLHWWARWARKRCERWMRTMVHEAREGRLQPPRDSALHHIAFHQDLSGQLLPPEIAAVELLNVIRPTVAVAVYLVQAMHALHRHPHSRSAIVASRAPDRAQVLAFVQEVRRCYPFFPAAIARVRADFTWQEYPFPRHHRVLLDLYGTNHDVRAWSDPAAFHPERFLERPDDDPSFVPQGGGDRQVTHRCPGEALAIELMTVTVDHFARTTSWRVPDQDLTLDDRHMPALPRSGMLVCGR